jgi:hypothetical protein
VTDKPGQLARSQLGFNLEGVLCVELEHLDRGRLKGCRMQGDTAKNAFDTAASRRTGLVAVNNAGAVHLINEVGIDLRVHSDTERGQEVNLAENVGVVLDSRALMQGGGEVASLALQVTSDRDGLNLALQVIKTSNDTLTRRHGRRKQGRGQSEGTC